MERRIEKRVHGSIWKERSLKCHVHRDVCEISLSFETLFPITYSLLRYFRGSVKTVRLLIILLSILDIRMLPLHGKRSKQSPRIYSITIVNYFYIRNTRVIYPWRSAHLDAQSDSRLWDVFAIRESLRSRFTQRWKNRYDVGIEVHGGEIYSLVCEFQATRVA